MDQHRIPVVPIYADSPMALAALSVYRNAINNGDPEITTATIAEGISQIHLPGLHEAHSTEESKKLDTPGPKIIISASGMASGGRVTHHLKYFLPHPNNCVLLVGYQAMGTPGQQLRDGVRSVRIHGQDIPVHAQVVDIEAFSVHADRSELVDWIASARTRPSGVYLVHAERDSASALKALIEGALGIPVTVAEDEMTVEVTAQVSH
jgi:metallo-beta-lactamase family protein